MLAFGSDTAGSVRIPACMTATAVAAKIFLHERVDPHRWMAALLVASGVALLAA